MLYLVPFTSKIWSRGAAAELPARYVRPKVNILMAPQGLAEWSPTQLQKCQKQIFSKNVPASKFLNFELFWGIGGGNSSYPGV